MNVYIVSGVCSPYPRVNDFNIIKAFSSLQKAKKYVKKEEERSELADKIYSSYLEFNDAIFNQDYYHFDGSNVIVKITDKRVNFINYLETFEDRKDIKLAFQSYAKSKKQEQQYTYHRLKIERKNIE